MNHHMESKGFISRCCVCARERVEGRWLAKIHVAEEPEVAGEPPVSHTYCPECLEACSPRRRTTGRARLLRGAA